MIFSHSKGVLTVHSNCDAGYFYSVMRKRRSKGNHRFLSAANEPLAAFENASNNSLAVDPVYDLNNDNSGSVKIELQTDEFEKNEALIKALPAVKNTAFIIHGTDDRKPVLETTYPYNVICLLIITAFDGRSFPATGFFISKRCIITAGHCVFERNHWVESAEVVPAALGSLKPFGSSIGKRFRSVNGWINNRDSNFDYGAIILDDDSLFDKINATIGFKVYNEERLIEIAGYPKDKNQTPWFATGSVLNKTQYKLFHEVDTESGNSGSPIIVTVNGKKYAAGLDTDGNYPNCGIRLRQEMLDRWSEWSKL